MSELSKRVTGKPVAKRAVPDRLHSSVRRLLLRRSAGDGEGQGVTADEVMLEIPGGDGAALAWIDDVQLFAETGALIDGLRVGVAEEKLRAIMGVAQCGFEGIVV